MTSPPSWSLRSFPSDLNPIPSPRSKMTRLSPARPHFHSVRRRFGILKDVWYGHVTPATGTGDGEERRGELMTNFTLKFCQRLFSLTTLKEPRTVCILYGLYSSTARPHIKRGIHCKPSLTSYLFLLPCLQLTTIVVCLSSCPSKRVGQVDTCTKQKQVFAPGSRQVAQRTCFGFRTRIRIVWRHLHTGRMRECTSLRLVATARYIHLEPIRRSSDDPQWEVVSDWHNRDLMVRTYNRKCNTNSSITLLILFVVYNAMPSPWNHQTTYQVPGTGYPSFDAL